jgi:predicted RNA-binding Zn ribbon-like protein
MDYPRRGLPLPLELVNTLFARAGQPCDALERPEDLHAWLSAHAERLPTLPQTSTPADVERFRALRAALRRIFSAVAEATLPSSEDIAVLNATGAAAPLFARLDWDRRPRITVIATADAVTSALGAVAHDAIQLLGGPNLQLITRCQAPGCVLFFLREPRRRHWCSAACGNRARVARHYARMRPQSLMGARTA